MSTEETSTSECHARAGEEGDAQQDLFITHQVSKLDTLAGLAVRYHVTVADIKRANGLLSDSAMFAKDTLLIPTRSLPVGVEYSTWAGMIVTQYGRIPGDSARNLAFGNSSPPKQSASLDMLQRYYGTGDTASEPSDFRPGDPDPHEGASLSGTEIEMSEMDHVGRILYRRGPQEATDCPESVEYAGSRSGTLADERLRRRKTGELSSSSSPLRGSNCRVADESPDPGRVAGVDGPQSGGDRMISHRRAMTQSQQQLGRRESIMERLKRVASQPALALPQAPSLARIGDAVVAPLTECLPPLPPGSKVRERSGASSPRPREKEGRKAD